MFDSTMVEIYQQDLPETLYDECDAPYYSSRFHSTVLDELATDPTQADIDRAAGFDDYDRYKKKEISAPLQPDNPAYMLGWRRNEEEFYKDWIAFCKD